MPQRPPNIDDIYLAALERSTTADRAAYLDQVCAGDLELRRRVERLLQAHPNVESFLESPAPELVPTLTERPLTEAPGTVIGPYKLLEQIGEGGFGVVFMAEQTAPVKRKVALKVIKPGMDTRQVIARFEAERQALALMDHPNIAKVLDAGATETGRPFFVMELVKGVPITDYCDQHQLTPRQRLELFVTVCQAVQHAHQKGIIHRDIKPTNVLVAEYDGGPVAKVIDFGVAKAMSQALTDRTMYTELGAIVGTLEYMSPEQARVNQLDVDTRSDIYSLGVLLYELLTGETPFDKQRLRTAAFDELLRIIREEEPPRPSTKLSSSATLPSIAANRKTEPARLSSLFRGELDWIVMKALEKDRTRRYETASAFAADVQHYLSDEAVAACPPSAGYRLRKFARRNRGKLSAVGLVLTCLLLLSAGGAWMLHEQSARHSQLLDDFRFALERAELLQQEGNYELALAAFERAQLLARSAEFDAGLQERLTILNGSLDAETKDRRFIARFEQVRREQSEVDETAGKFTDEVAFPRIAEALREFGIEIGITPPGQVAGIIRSRPETVQTQLVAALNECLWRAPESEIEARQWLIDTLLLADDEGWRSDVRAAWSDKERLSQLAREVDIRSQPPSFLYMLTTHLPSIDERISLSRKVQRAYPDDFWANHRLGMELWHARQPAEGVRYFTAALSLSPDNAGEYLNRALCLEELQEYDEALADALRATELKPHYAMAWRATGRLLQHTGRYPEAVNAWRKALKYNPADVIVHDYLAGVLTTLGDLSEAESECREAMRLNPRETKYVLRLGNILRERDKVEEAEVAYRDVLQREEQGLLAERDFDRRNSRYYQRDAHVGLAYLHERREEFAQAEGEWREALRLDPQSLQLHWYVARTLDLQGRHSDSELEYRQIIRINPEFAEAHQGLAASLERQDRFDEAEAAYRAALQRFPRTLSIHRELADFLSRRDKLEEARGCLEEALSLFRNDLSAVAWLLNSLVDVLTRLDNLEQPGTAIQKAISLLPDDLRNDARLARVLCILGIQRAAAGRSAEAIEAWEEAIRTQPEHPDAYWRLGSMLTTSPDSTLRDPSRALEVAARGAQLDPQSCQTWLSLGQAEYRSGHWQASLDALDRSCALVNDPEREAAYQRCFLAMAHWQLGHREEARQWYAKALTSIDAWPAMDEVLVRIREEAAQLLGASSAAMTDE